MKVIERVLDVNSTLGGEKVGMTIDHSALAHIMSVLTDLYSDPELAVIREYSTNALDSHIEAGQTRPIEITLPSPLSPFLRIRDYGIGMDADGIRDTYSRYGTSTKRNSDDVVGMLGLGCKSALTYTDQFTLTGIKDGRMIQVSIGRDEDGSGSMSIVADHETDDLPGVEVIIPAKRGNAFEGKALDFFRFWTAGTVLVNGEQPKPITGQWITDSITITTETDSDYVVMGNVAYPVPDNALSVLGDARRAYYRQDYTVAFVPIGAVQFTPSREALQMTKLTRETLAVLKMERDEKLDAALQANIAAADTPFEAILTWQQAKKIGLSGGATYKGYELREELWRENSRTGNRYEETYLVTTPHKHSRFRLTGTWQSTIQVETTTNLYFEMFDGASLTNVKRAKLMQYLDANPNDSSRWVFVRGKLTKDERFWLDGATVINWADVDAEKLPRDPTTKKVGPRGAYKGRTAGGTWEPVMADKIDTSKPIVYHHGNRWSFQYGFESKHGMIPPDVLVVCLEANRIEKFQRDFPTAQSVTQYAAAYVKKEIAAWDATKLKAAKFQQMSGVGLLKQLPADRIADPNIKEGIKLAGIDTAAIKERLVYWSHHAPEVEVTNPLDKYPLLRYTRSITDAVEIDHAVTYINAAFAADRS